MAGKACHAFASTTQFGLTQALGAMSDFICNVCKSRISDHLVRATQAHPDGEVTCQNCGAQLAVQVKSAKEKAIALVAIGALVFLIPYLFTDSVYRQVAGAVGIVVFVVSAIRLHTLSKRLLQVGHSNGT